MTTKQTIDGVPREVLLEAFDALDWNTPAAAKLRALLDAPAAKNWEYFHNAMESERDYWMEKCTKSGNPVYQIMSLTDGQGWHDVTAERYEVAKLAPEFNKARILYDGLAAQPQGEPSHWTDPAGNTITAELKAYNLNLGGAPAAASGAYTKPLYAEQPVPVAVVLDGYCIMPRRLTAENGAKALLLGEFKLQVTEECPECRELDEPTEGCEICDGEGEYGQQYTISWDQIKFIYSKAVEGLAVKAETDKP